MESLSLVRECRDLEERYKTNFTSAILSATDQDGLDIIRTAQKSINKIDQSLLLQKISKYPSLHKIAECIGWKKNSGTMHSTMVSQPSRVRRTL